jgi:ubiquinone/menaquinone biosynthesis C-methylase UbiE
MPLASLFRKNRTRPESVTAREDEPIPGGYILAHNKACNYEDFHHPTLVQVMRSLFLHDMLRFGETFPVGREDRYYWQSAVIARAFTDFRVLGPKAQILGVGAGNAPIVFWLTNKVRQVYAIDLYLRPGSAAAQQCATMMSEPDRHWPGSWNPRRLVVQHMDPLDLRYADESFDAVFAMHALDRYPTAEESQDALREMHRVLRPGGLLSLLLEFQSDGHVFPLGLPMRRLFHEKEVREEVIGSQEWTPVDAPDFGLSEHTRNAEQPAEADAEDIRRCVAAHGQLLWHEMNRSRYPFLSLRDGNRLSTCVHLALRKTG